MAQEIVTEPSILGGKPCIKGTRISVEFILELLASGASQQDVLKKYPQVTAQGLAAALQYAAQSMKNEVVWELKPHA